MIAEFCSELESSPCTNQAHIDNLNSTIITRQSFD